MKTKICSIYKQEKELFEFSFRKDCQRYRNSCKKCRNLQQKKYVKNNKNLIYFKRREFYNRYSWMRSYYALRHRCNNPNASDYKYYGGRGIKCFITKEEIKQLWFRDEAYKMKSPSIDRIDNNGHYEYSNCRFIELSENISKKWN